MRHRLGLFLPVQLLADLANSDSAFFALVSLFFQLSVILPVFQDGRLKLCSNFFISGIVYDVVPFVRVF